MDTQVIAFRIMLVVMMGICVLLKEGSLAARTKSFDSAIDKFVEDEYDELLEDEISKLENELNASDNDVFTNSEFAENSSEDLKQKSNSQIDRFNILREQKGYGPTSERIELQDDQLDDINNIFNELESSEDFM